MLTIGNLTLPFPLLLAPMAGISDLPFRLIARSFGAPMAFAEMLDAQALGHQDRRTLRMLFSNENDRPLGVQLLGNEADALIKAVEALDGYPYDLLDFNAACPVPKVVRKGKGATLLKEPGKLEVLLKVLVRCANAPVTVKIRSGWDAASKNAREVALRAEDAGVSALFIHGRTRSQGYNQPVDYGVIRKVKEALRIPVIASGDNLSVPLIRKMFDETGCDGVAIARGALGNPWIFREMNAFIEGDGSFAMPSARERTTVMKAHLSLSLGHYDEFRAVSLFRKNFVWYTKGLPGVKPLRDRIMRVATKEEMIEIIEAVRELDGASGPVRHRFQARS